ncbi:MAG: tRNA lysidine(34) synthetase TilS [Acidiphilium sp.]|nr:tRNA lysidine(34) synthetase TilS [Acidiphilium sp.]MDD4934348.1 tRNA lysidine(34) synthetase TilS [Acidiphilium sp.]
MSLPPLAFRFDEAMGALGSFGPRPLLAVAVSGGADSTALVLLAHDWARARGGSVLALIADHGLRRESATEAATTASRLAGAGIASRIVTLAIPPGSALQERARIARHAALAAAAREAGAIHLLFGHHAADQAEVLAMRAARGSGGAAGMAAFAARHDVVLLRPLLGVAPVELRAELQRRRIDWIEDPSNADPRFERVRVRVSGIGATLNGGDAADTLAAAQREAAGFLARNASIHPAGFAILRAESAPHEALAALIRTLGGATHPARRDAIARLAGSLHAATLGGVRIMRAGRFGDGWLLCREPVACAPPIAAIPGATWDRRFRIRTVPSQANQLGKLGMFAPAFRACSSLPSVVLRGLPAFFRDGVVVAVPHCGTDAIATLTNAPPLPVAALPFTRLPRAVRLCASSSAQNDEAWA